MGLRSWIAEGVGTMAAISAFRKSPVVQAAVIRSSLVFDSLPLTKHLTEDTKSHLANTLFQRIQAICLSPDPVAACRTEFCGSVIENASIRYWCFPHLQSRTQQGFAGNRASLAN